VLPSPTKAVFNQIQAHILTIDTHNVKLGLSGKRDETTKNIVVQKRPELEEVFRKVLQRPIKVMFTFVTATTPQSGQVQVTAPLPVSPAIAPPPVTYPNPISQPIPTSQSAPPANVPTTNVPTANVPTANVPIANVDPDPVAPKPQPKGYVGMSDDDRVIKNLADLFNGQIVDLDEEPDEP